MTAKEYLSGYKDMCEQLSDRLQEVRGLKDMKYNISASFDSASKASGGDSRMSRIVAKMDELEELVEREVACITSKKMEIERAIGSVKNEQFRTLLEKKYIQFKSLEVIAVEMGYGYRHICRLHGEALKQIRCH